MIGVLGLAWLNYAMRTFVGLSEIMIGASLLVVVLLAPRAFWARCATRAPPPRQGRRRASMILDAQNIEMSYGQLKVLHGVSLQVDEGQTFAIIGPRRRQDDAVQGAHRRAHGERRYRGFRGQDVSKLPAFKRARLGFGRTFQVARIFTELDL